MLRPIFPTLYNKCNFLAMAKSFAADGGATNKPTAISGGAITKLPTTSGGGVSKPSAGPAKTPNPHFEKIKKLQEHFQKDDGKPVFLKGGSRDLLLYRLTCTLAIIGLLLQIQMFAQYIVK